jgi:hypothetical protein
VFRTYGATMFGWTTVTGGTSGDRSLGKPLPESVSAGMSSRWPQPKETLPPINSYAPDQLQPDEIVVQLVEAEGRELMARRRQPAARSTSYETDEETCATSVQSRLPG